MWTLALLLFLAAPDRDGLLEAWEASFAPEAELTRSDDGAYRLVEPQFAYDGPVRVIGTHVSEYDGSSLGLPVSHQGVIDFRLELDEERAGSVLFYTWQAQHQNFYYLEDEARWIDQEAFGRLLGERGTRVGWFGLFAGYGSVLLIIVVLVVAIVAVGRQLPKARKLMSESFDINRLARENIEHATALQDQQKQLQDEALALAREQVALLREIRDTLKKDSGDR